MSDLLRFEFLSSHLAGFRPAGSHCEKSGKSDDTCASARSGCAKQRSLLCPLSERGWRHPLLFAVLDLLVLLDQDKSTEEKNTRQKKSILREEFRREDRLHRICGSKSAEHAHSGGPPRAEASARAAQRRRNARLRPRGRPDIGDIGRKATRKVMRFRYFFRTFVAMNERLIFLTNDDGFDSRGMEALIDIARRFGRVVVVAPERPQSGMSHAFTMLSPLFIRKVREEEGLEVYALSGTPVDCVKVAFDYLLRERKVDLVLSGINHGSNSAVALLYSGTMGAAIEGSFYDCPSIGLSLTDHRPDADFTAARIWGERIVRDVLEHPAPLPLCLNVNIPAGAPETIRGIRVCRQAQGLWREQFVCRQDSHGRDYLWLTGEFVNDEHGAEETDEWALTHGYVSVQPVQADQTDYRRMEEMRRLFDR